MRAVNRLPNHLTTIAGVTPLSLCHNSFFRPISFFLLRHSSSHSTFLSPPLSIHLLFSSYYRPTSELFSELHHEIILPAIVSPLLPVSKCSQSANWNGELLIDTDPQESWLWGYYSSCQSLLVSVGLQPVECRKTNNRNTDAAHIITWQQIIDQFCHKYSCCLRIQYSRRLKGYGQCTVISVTVPLSNALDSRLL